MISLIFRVIEKPNSRLGVRGTAWALIIHLSDKELVFGIILSRDVTSLQIDGEDIRHIIIILLYRKF